MLLNDAEPLHADGRMNSITGRVLAIPAASVTNSGASSSRALHVELNSQQVSAKTMKSGEHLGLGHLAMLFTSLQLQHGRPVMLTC